MLQRPTLTEQENQITGRSSSSTVSIAGEVPGNLEASMLTEPGETELPVPVRGKPLTAEEVFRYGAGIRGQYEAMVRRQQEIEQDAARLKLIHEDIRGSREELDGLESKLTGLVTMAERLLARLDARLAQLDEKQKTVEQAENALPASVGTSQTAQLKNTKRISEIISGMSENDAAEYLRELSNAGKLSVASQVLNQIEPRDAAKILSGFCRTLYWWSN